MASYRHPDLPPRPSGRSDRDSGISISSQQAGSVAQASGTPYGGWDRDVSVSSQARPHGRPYQKSVHWPDNILPRSSYRPGKHLARISDDLYTSSSDVSSTEEASRSHRAGGGALEDDAYGKAREYLRARSSGPLGTKKIEESTEKPPVRKVDGFCHAGDAKDVTVRLRLELCDDLTDEVEQLRLLIQLGRFDDAKKHFTEHLEPHAHHPYVRVEYADMLWRQGDFNSLAHLVAQPLRGTGEGRLHSQDDVHLDVGPPRDETTSAEEDQALHQYWTVLRTYTRAVHGIAQLAEPEREDLHEAIQALEKVLRRQDKAISANEVGGDDPAIAAARLMTTRQVRILDLLIRLHEYYLSTSSEMDIHLEFFVIWVKATQAWRGFYQGLLRQGRIWDFRDLFCGLAHATGYENALSGILGMPTSSTTETRLATQRLIADWTNALPEDNCSNKLALLSVCIHIPRMAMSLETSTGRPDADYLDEFTPLVHSILVHHPAALRSRPYLDWILCRVYQTNVQGTKDQADFAALLSASPGVFMHDELLPMYIPRRDENPGWKLPDAKPEFKDAVRMALRIAREIGDCVIQVAALTILIWISNDPADAFEELGTLLKLLGDNTGYTRLLISKYLVSTTPELRNELKQEVAALLSKPGPLRAMSPDVAWMVKMLYVKLEGPDSLLSRGPLDDACSLQDKGRLSKVLQHRIAARSPFAKEDIQRRPVGSGALESEPQPYTTMGHQASQSSPSDWQLVATGTKRHPYHETMPSGSLQLRDRLRPESNTSLASPHAGIIGPHKGKMPAGEGQKRSRHHGVERERVTPSSSRNLGNHLQEPSETQPSRFSSLAHPDYEEETFDWAKSVLKEKQRMAVEEGDEDREKALAVSCSEIDRELRRLISRRQGSETHSTKPPPRLPFGNEESERTRPVPPDERGEPSARGTGPPVASSTIPPWEKSGCRLRPDLSGQAKEQERQGDVENMAADTAVNHQQPGRDTSETEDEEDASSISAPSDIRSDRERY